MAAVLAQEIPMAAVTERILARFSEVFNAEMKLRAGLPWRDHFRPLMRFVKLIVVLTVVAHRGFSPEFVAGIDRLKMGEGFSGRVAQSGQPLLVENASTDPRLTRMVVRQAGLHSAAIVPLSSKGKVLGTLFALAREYREFSERDVQLLTSIGHQIGVAIENAQLFKAEQRRAEQFRVIGEVGHSITSILVVDELLNRMARLINEAFDYSHVGIGLIEGDQLVSKAEVGPWRDAYQSQRLKVGQEGVWGWVAQSGKPLLVADVRQEPRYQLAPEAADVRSQLCVPLRTKEAIIGVLSIESDQTNAFDESDLTVLQSLANQAAIGIENARLYEQAQQRIRELEALYRADEELYRHLDLDEVLQALVDIGVDILEADKSFLIVWDEGREQLVARAARGFSPETVALLSFSRGEGTVGHVAGTGEPVILEDALTDPRRKDERPEVVEAAVSSEGIRSFMHLPIKIGDEVFGVFNASFTAPHAFGEDELRLFAALAGRAALAIENAQLYEQTQELAVMEERQRLARELHDSVTQALYGITLYSQAAAGQLSLGHADRVAEQLRELQDTAQEALAEMRLLIFELRPPVLEKEGLVATLQARLQAVEGRVGLKTKFKVEGEGRLPPETEDGLYRIAQEALNNALRHAHARNITVYLRQAERTVTLEVSDDGVGFNPATARERGGLGLSAMEERAVELGGHLIVKSGPGEGTRVIVEVFV